MSANEHNAPAFPQPFAKDSGGNCYPAYEWRPDAGGLTKREMFAMAAMQAILASGVNPHVTPATAIADRAVEYADALLAKVSS